MMTREMDLPLHVVLADGERIPVRPSRALAAYSIGHEESMIWFFDDDDLIDSVSIEADVRLVREALWLGDD